MSPADTDRGGAPRSTPGGLPYCNIDARPRNVRPEPPALAFGSRSSVFKERPGTRPEGVGAGSEAGRGEHATEVRFVSPNGSDRAGSAGC